mgnify:CR=1 FL=1|tara:strand:- start:1428 stop:1685 length:258 start_codon:yes stop_codon:yes gene_type:complete
MPKTVDKETLSYRDKVYQDNVRRINSNSVKKNIKNTSEIGTFKNICFWTKDGSCHNQTRYKYENKQKSRYEYYCDPCLEHEELPI